MIDDVRITFLALRESPSAQGELKILPFGDRHGVFLGLDDLHRQHLLLATPEGAVPTSDIASVTLASRTLDVSGVPTRLLDIACLFETLAEVFDYFVVAVIERLEDETTTAERAVAEVLAQWRQFLVAAAGLPGRDRLASVFGELVVLLDVVRAHGGAAVDVWVGPFGGRHDLRRGTTAIEVKTTRSHTSRAVTIHGEDQLLEPENGTLFLHLVRLEEVPDGGRSVSTLVDEILATGVPAREFYEALAAAGVPPAGLAAADSIRFDVRERITFPIDGRIPRIIPASFVGGARPVGVIDVTYRIDLDHALDLALDVPAYDEVVGLLAGRGGA